MIDRLINEILKKACPVCAGLDTTIERVPPNLLCGDPGPDPLAWAAERLLTYNRLLIDALSDLVPCVKLQFACYEMYGPAGVEAARETIQIAKSRNLVVIADAKRSDIGSSAACYADAFIGSTFVKEKAEPAFDADFVTVNPYLGGDGIEPFVAACREFDRGIFVLVKTSNPSGSQVQDLKLEDGSRVYDQMMRYTYEWGADLVGTSGFSEVGAVVGATHPEQAAALRKQYPGVFMLLPGCGTQGACASDLVACFDRDGRGGIINTSRAMLLGWKKYPELEPGKAARRVVEDLQREILAAFSAHDIHFDRNGAAYHG